jgi:hypothetical protein
MVLVFLCLLNYRNITQANVLEIENFNGVHTRTEVWAQVNTLHSRINDKRHDGAEVPQNYSYELRMCVYKLVLVTYVRRHVQEETLKSGLLYKNRGAENGVSTFSNTDSQ